MKALLGLVALFCCDLCCPPLWAQTDDWTQVERLHPGTQVTLTTWHRAPCILRSSDDDGVECVYRGAVYWVDRARILRVSVRSQGRSVALGTILGVFAGASAEAMTDGAGNSDKVPRLLVGAALGGCVGWLIGHGGDHAEWIVYEPPVNSP